MNNYAFGLKVRPKLWGQHSCQIPLTVHIIFRSGGELVPPVLHFPQELIPGLCVSMLTGYFLARKRYSFGQVIAGVVITVGIVLATVSAPRPPRSPASSASKAPQTDDKLSESLQYALGIAMLSLALFLSAWLGLWQERTYRRYGNQWREALFYTVSRSISSKLTNSTSSLSLSSYRWHPPLYQHSRRTVQRHLCACSRCRCPRLRTATISNGATLRFPVPCWR